MDPKPPQPPTSEEQVRFLRNVQRLFDEGTFVASYKFALLHALADMAVTNGDDTGATLGIETREIAARFIELYWRQGRPYPLQGGETPRVLKQNTGKQAAVVRDIERCYAQHEGSLARLRDDASWTGLLGRVDRTIREMPLWKLQTVGQEQVEFLYGNEEASRSITLKPGVAYCLRAFYPLLRDMIQGAWVRHVRKINAALLGDVSDLPSFMFGNERGDLAPYRRVLRDLQGDRCFYCRKPLNRKGDVDHFVPWARYPSDLAHNFVLAHASCNRSKSNHLAAEDHLAAWHERNTRHVEWMHGQFRAADLPSNLDASVGIAMWAYTQTENANGQVWVRGRVLRSLTSEWRDVFHAAPDSPVVFTRFLEN